MPAIRNEPYVTLAPDWAREVLSPSTAKTDRADKLPIYAREAMPHVWLSPLDRTLEVLGLDQARYAILGVWRDDAQVRAAPFEAFELDLSILWADVDLG